MCANNFLSRLKEEYLMLYPETDIELSSVIKNNDVIEHKYVFREFDNCAPMFSLEWLEALYNKGASIESIVTMIHSSQNFGRQISVDNLCNTDRITACLVNKKLNTNRLKDLPYYEFEDLAIIFKLIINRTNKIQQSLTISDKMLDYIGIKKEQLMEYAIKNQPTLTPIVHDNLMAFTKRYCKTLPYLEDIGLIMVSFYNMINGASAVIYKDKMRDILKYYNMDKAYCIPSSIHEVILAPCIDNLCDAQSLKHFIRMVNNECLPKSEILSDNLYLIDGDGVFKMI